jgi:hypothetical protein
VIRLVVCDASLVCGHGRFGVAASHVMYSLRYITEC